MTDMLTTIFQVLGYIVAAGGIIGAIIAAAWALFMMFGGKWLDARFNSRLEAIKAANQQELEQLKLRINTLFDRTIKLHQREFEVLPQTWGLLIEAYSNIQSVVSSFQQYPNLDAMQPDELEDFLSRSNLSDWRKSQLRAATKKVDYYMEAIGYERLFEAKRSLRDYQEYLIKNGIFLPRDLKDKFSHALDALRTAISNHEFIIRHGKSVDTAKIFESMVEAATTATKTIESLESEVQSRFWSLKLSTDQ